MELDPVFVRALRLLHSKAPDSASQLRVMLEEAIRHRKGLGPGPVGTPSSPTSSKERSSPFDLSMGATRRDAADKRSIDRLKHDLSELAVPGLAAKRPRMDSPRSSAGFSSKSHTPSPTPPGSRGELEKQSSSGSGGNSSEDAEEMELDDITLEGLNDCTCCVCKSFNQENGNKLMECQTCQNLYHQECHFPVVSNEEANDPRLVWNCSECSRKNPSLKQSSKSGSKGLGLTSVSPSPKSARASPSKFTEITSTSSSAFKKVSGSGGGKPAGMAALAASYKSSSSSSSSSSTMRPSRSGSTSASSSSSSSTTSKSQSAGSASGSSNLLSADKRIMMMKKKAAARKIK